MKDWHNASGALDEEIKWCEKCKRESDDAFKRVSSDQAEYDKQLLALSSAFLAVSLAFIKDVVPLRVAQFLSFLYLSYALLAACIVLVLFSYQFSIAGNLRAKKYWDELQVGNETKFPYGHANWVKWLNRSSGILFVSGVSLIVAFVILNIHNEVSMSKALTSEGAYVKTPVRKTIEERGSLIKAPSKPAPSQPTSSGSIHTDQSKK